METNKCRKHCWGRVSFSAKAGLQRHNRGQVSFYDFLIAVMLFMIAFTVLNGIWTNNYSNATGMLAMNDMESRTLQALSALVKTPGYPESWTGSNVEIIGLCSKKNTVEETKLEQFKSMTESSYATVKDKLKLTGYDFNFEFIAQNPADNFSVGSMPSSGKNIISLARAVEFKGGSAIVQFKVFR
ncbi:MAG: hypothetical protein NT067_06100 [Candidatus Diapherotrites archaeon]|nr:hypothetical protein [Candidatus Diapherotrites archaeon]